MDYEVYLCVKITKEQLKDTDLDTVGELLSRCAGHAGYGDVDWWYEEVREEDE